MRKHVYAYLIIAVASLLLSASCEGQQGNATLRVNIQKQRAIAPEDYPLEIESYRVSGAGPSGASFSVETSRQSVTIEGLAIGEWKLKAEGLNSNGDALVAGEAMHSLSGTNGTVSIELSAAAGIGNVSIVLDWDTGEIRSTPDISASLVPIAPGGETVKMAEESIDTRSGEAVFTADGVPSGPYILAAEIFSGETKAGGAAAALQVVSDLASEGTLGFMDGEAGDSSPAELLNDEGIAIACSIGETGTVTADKAFTAELSSGTDDMDGFLISWYLDGVHAGDGPQAEITAEEGFHRLDAIVSSSLLGPASCATIHFMAEKAADPGIPVVQGIALDGEDVSLGYDSIAIFLPDGKLMMISNEERTVQIASTEHGSISIEREYPFSSIGISGTVAGAAAADLSASMSKVLIGANDPLEVRVYNYSPISSTLSLYAEDDGNVIFPFTEDTPAGSIEAVYMARGIEAGGCVPGILMLKNADGSRIAGVFVNLTSSTGDDGQFYGTLGGSGMSPSGVRLLSGSVSGNGALFTYSTDIIMSSQSCRYSESYGGDYSLHVTSATGFAPEDEHLASGLVCASLIADDIMLLFGDYEAIVDISGGSRWKVLSEDRRSGTKIALTAADDFRYAYCIDGSTDELVAMRIEPGGRAVTEIGRAALPEHGCDTIALSPAGTEMVAYSAMDTDSLTIMRIGQ